MNEYEKNKNSQKLFDNIICLPLNLYLKVQLTNT